MNKDVIKVSPEDDITDIIAQIKSSTQKIIAIVPPNPSGILRSAVNIKLIAKTASEEKKVPVLITSDPTLLKFATKFDFHVSDSLQSKPYIPSEEDLAEATVSQEKIAEDFVKSSDEVSEVILDEVSEDVSEEKESDSIHEKEPESENSSDDEAPELSEKKEKTKKLPSAFALKFPWIAEHKKLLIFGSLALVLVAVFLVWALVYAPAVDIKVAIRTSTSNFSESVSFTTNATGEEAKSGKFFLQEEKLADESKVEFTATGKKDIGDKSTGELTVSAEFDAKASSGLVTIAANSQFTYNNLSYLSTEDNKIEWDGNNSNCENDVKDNKCLKSITIKVTAAEPGDKYHVKAGQSDWSAPTAKGIKSIYNPKEITGGNNKIVTVVSQEDIDNARGKLNNTMSESEGKKKLFAKIPDSMLMIEDTFKSTVGESETNVKVGEEVPEGTTPTVLQKSEFMVYVVDKVKIEEYISTKATLASDQKIYSVGNPFVEYFNQSGESYTAKLKTTYKVGPKVTEADILEKASGRKIGEVQSLLKSINGVSTVDIAKSYFWVSSVPTDANKVTISVSVEE